MVPRVPRSDDNLITTWMMDPHGDRIGAACLGCARLVAPQRPAASKQLKCGLVSGLGAARHVSSEPLTLQVEFVDRSAQMNIADALQVSWGAYRVASASCSQGR